MSDAKAETKTKASGVDDSAKVRLLLSYIKQCRPASVNWQTIAEECDITGTDGQPSKGAANKRFSRILKAAGVDLAALNKGAVDGENSPSKTTPSKTSPSKSFTPGTKRKANKLVDSHNNSEDDTETESKKRKTEAAKEEESAEEVVDEF